MLALGFMSGTSLDGVDAALIETDGLTISRFGPAITLPYPQSFRERLYNVFGAQKDTPEIYQLSQELTDFHVMAFKELNQKPEIIGFHGQTISHAPPFTWQIGDGQRLARLTQCPVVYDFRKEDVLQGGQGAPLVPIYHQALMKNETQPLAVINIGGVANVTYMDDCSLIAFDTGPGMALLDDWIKHHLNVPYDLDGKIAQQGKPNPSIITKWLSHDYFKKPFPKSLDRQTFARIFDDLHSLPVEDGAATLAKLTAESILLSLRACPNKPKKLWLTGGGRHHQEIMRTLKEHFPVNLMDDIGISGDFLEAQAFGFLAVRHMKKLPLSYPQTTGVKVPTQGGLLAIP